MVFGPTISFVRRYSGVPRPRRTPPRRAPPPPPPPLWWRVGRWHPPLCFGGGGVGPAGGWVGVF
eukprot:COSAG01_NODE_32752_length_573_cov_0.482180_2_plen_63_part_01